MRRTDVRRPEECLALIGPPSSEFGRIDILVNNAGGSKSFPLDEWTTDEFDNSIALNLRSAFVLSRQAALHMMARAGGASSTSRRWRARQQCRASVPTAWPRPE